MPEQGNGKPNGRTSRRVIGTVVWYVSINAVLLRCLGAESGLEWFVEYAKILTFGLVFFVSGLTITDVFQKK